MVIISPQFLGCGTFQLAEFPGVILQVEKVVYRWCFLFKQGNHTTTGSKDFVNCSFRVGLYTSYK